MKVKDLILELESQNKEADIVIHVNSYSEYEPTGIGFKDGGYTNTIIICGKEIED